MIHRNAAVASTKRVAVAILAAVLMTIGSPFVAVSSATAGSPGAGKYMGPTHGDCKNHNSGHHYGYVCAEPSSGFQPT